MTDTIIQALRDYFLACPLLEKNRINVDYLPEKGAEYSIDTTPATEILKRYVNGDSVRQYLFVFRSVEEYGADTLQNIANSGIFEGLSAWMEAQSKAKNLPALPAGREARKLEAQSTGYLFAAGASAGKYQIQCKLTYYMKGETT